MTRKLNAVIDEDLLSKIDKLAEREKRTRSAMTQLLLAEAVEARGKNEQTM